VADFVDKDILKKLEVLEKEEEERERAGVYDNEEDEEDPEMEEIHQLAEKIRTKKKLMKNEQRLEGTKKPRLPRTSEPKKRERSVSRLKREFEDLGVDMTGTDDANFTQTIKRGRSLSQPRVKRAREDSSVRKSRDKSGVREGDEVKLRKVQKGLQRRKFARAGKAGESDRHIAVKKPKHLFAGKRGVGKADRR